MNQSYNWSGFYNSLCQNGPDLLMGIDEDLREVIREIGTTTDMFWSENLEEFLARGAADDSIKRWGASGVRPMANEYGRPDGW